MSELDIRAYTVGPVQENCYIVRAGTSAHPPGGARESTSALIVDPGDEPQRLLSAAAALGVTIEAILVTHTHFDHIGAVAPVARATGAPVYCPQIERSVLADIMRWVPPGFGPFESYEADHTLAGGEQLSLAGLEIDVLSTPGHSPGHLTFAIGLPSAQPEQGTARPAGRERGLLSGDVLFQGSVGRVDLPGGDWATLERSIGSLIESFPPETVVYPGHMAVTTLGRELETNPFLRELRAGVPQTAAPPGGTAPAS